MNCPYKGFRLPARSRFGEGRGAPVNGISKTQLASACLREAPLCGTKVGAFLSSLRNNHFFNNLLDIGRVAGPFTGGE